SRPVRGARQPSATAPVPKIGAGQHLGALRRWLVVRDLARAVRIADVEDANAGLEVATCEDPRVVLVVHVAVVAVVDEAWIGRFGQGDQAVTWIMRLEHQVRGE